MEQDKKPNMQELDENELAQVTGGETIDMRLHFDDDHFDRVSGTYKLKCVVCGYETDDAMKVWWHSSTSDGHTRSVVFLWCVKCFSMNILMESIH